MAESTGIVLAGGASRRMGTDKRLVLIDGEPMLHRVTRIVAEATDEVILAVSEAHPLPPGILYVAARTVVDRRPDSGPLAGLEAALAASAHSLTLVAAADMPWIEADTLRALLERLDRTDADAVAVATDRGPQPLLAAYRRERTLEAATRLLDAGELRMRALLDALAVESVEAPEPVAVNVNAPGDLAAIRT